MGSFANSSYKEHPGRNASLGGAERLVLTPQNGLGDTLLVSAYGREGFSGGLRDVLWACLLTPGENGEAFRGQATIKAPPAGSDWKFGFAWPKRGPGIVMHTVVEGDAGNLALRLNWGWPDLLVRRRSLSHMPETIRSRWTRGTPACSEP